MILFLFKSIKILSLWSDIIPNRYDVMIVIFKYGTPTKSSAIIEAMFHKVLYFHFKNIDLLTSLDRRVISLRVSALLKTANIFNEEN